METELGKKVKALRADRGGEFLSDEFKCYLKKFGTHSISCLYSPQQNRASEWLNWILVEAAIGQYSHMLVLTMLIGLKQLQPQLIYRMVYCGMVRNQTWNTFDYLAV